MPSVNETVRDLIAAYPCSHMNRTQALHHILVVGGSGHEWRDGEVVERSPEDRTCARRHERNKCLFPNPETAGRCHGTAGPGRKAPFAERSR